MIIRLRTLALLSLLTLLQGIAPLLHAHVGGHFVRTGTHLHLTPVPIRAVVDSVGHASLPALHEHDSFQISEAAEVGMGLVIERRLLLVTSAATPALPPSLWSLLASPVDNEALLPAQGVPLLRMGRKSARPPPSNAPPAHHYC